MKRLLFNTFLFTFFAFFANSQVSFTSNPAATNGALSICQGQTVTYTNTSSGFINPTYLWTFTGGNTTSASTAGPHSITYNTVGNYIAKLKIGIDEVSITVNVGTNNVAAPTLNYTNALSINPDYSSNLFNGVTTFTRCGYFPNGNFSFIDPNQTNYPAGTSQNISWGDNTSNYTSNTTTVSNPTFSHTYNTGLFILNYTVTYPNGCSATKTYNVFVGNEAPTLQVTGSGSISCLPSYYQFQVAAFNSNGAYSNPPGTNYTITYDDGSPVTYFNGSLPSNPLTEQHTFLQTSCGHTVPGNPVQNNAYSITFSAFNACSPTGTSLTLSPIRVGSSVDAITTVTPSQNICVGDIITLNDISTTGLNISNNSCTSTVGKFWKISPNSNYSITAGSLGSSNGYMPGTTLGYSWGSWISGSTNLSLNFSQPGTYDVTFYLGNNCGLDSITKTIVVNPRPLVPTQAITVCSNSSFSFAPTNNPPNTIIPTGTTYQWGLPTFSTPGTITGGASGSGPFIIGNLINSSNTTQVATYIVTPVTGNCVGDTFLFKVSVIPNLVIPNAQYTICSGSSFNATPINNPPTVIVPTGSSYTWTVADNPSITGESNGNGNTISQTLTNTTFTNQSVVYTITGSTQGNCPSVNFTVTVFVNNLNAGKIASNQTVCLNGIPATLTDSISAVGAGTLSYTWENSIDGVNFTTIPGATLATFTPPALNTKTYYRRKVTSTLNGIPCANYSNIVTISINSVNSGTIGVANTYCLGDDPSPLSLTSSSIGTGALTYQWTSNTVSSSSIFNSISGQTGMSYDPPTGFSATTYFQLISTSTTNGVSCSSKSNVVTLTLNSISAGSISANQTICKGDVPAQLNGTSATGSSTPTYQWFSSTDNVSFTPTSGATGINYSPAALLVTTYFKRKATSTLNGVSCSIESNTITITVNQVTAGGIQSNQTICNGDDPAPFTETFASTGSGALTYQWQSSTNGTVFTNIPFATAITYDVTGGQTATSYYQRITTSTLNGKVCTSTSNLLTVNVNNISAIISGNQTICSGDDPTLISANTTSTTGSTLTYQWQISTDNVVFSDLNGATNATYNPGITNSTTYYRRITTSSLNSVSCTHTSNVVTITVNSIDAGTISQSQTICSGGDPVAFTNTVNPTSSGVLSYQWQSSLNGVLFTDISGQTGATYNIPAGLTLNTHYRRITTSILNSIVCKDTTNQLLITINNVSAPVLPIKQTICNGGDPSLITPTTAASGTALTYQWQSSTTSAIAGFSDISGATNATFDPASGITQLTFYRVIATSILNGITCSAISNVDSIIVNNVTGGVIAGTQTICVGEDPIAFTQTTASTGQGGLLYQWQVSTDNTTFTDITGETGLTYNPPILTPSITRYYRRVTTNILNSIACSAFSNTLTVFVNSVTASTISSNQTICSGDDPASFTITTPASANGTISYQWQQSTTSSSSGYTTISGATTATFDPGVIANNTYYQVVVTSLLNSKNCTATSNPLSITINTLNVGTLSANQTICNGGNPTAFTVVTAATSAGSISYQWQVSTTSATAGFFDITNETNATYDVPVGLTATSYYKRIVTSVLNGQTCVNSNTVITVFVNNLTAGVIGSNQTVCSLQNPAIISEITAPILTNSTAVLSYQWQSSTDNLNFTNISSATSISYDPPAGITATTYFRRITYSIFNGVTCNATTNIITVTVNNVNAGNISSNQTICNLGDPATINSVSTPPSGSGLVTYQWESSTTSSSIGFTPIIGAINESYDPPAGLTQTTYFRRKVTSTLNGQSCDGYTNVITVTINTIQSGTIGSNETICSGGDPINLTQTAAASGLGILSYQWQSSINGVIFDDIIGATLATYNPPAGQLLTTYFRRNVTSTINANECIATSNIVTVFVNDISANTIGSNQLICSGDDPSVLNTIVNGISSGTTSYQWSSSTSNASSGFNAITNATNASFDPSVLTITTYYKLTTTSLLNNKACSIESNVVTITVNPLPVITSAATKTICSGSSVAQTLTSSINTTFEWFATSNISVLGESTSTQSGNLINDVLSDTTKISHTIVYTITPTSVTGSCVGQIQQLTVTVNPLPIIGNYLEEICSGTSFSTTPVHQSPQTIVPTGTLYSWPTPISNPVGAITGGSLANNQANIGQNLVNTTNTPATLTYTVTPKLGSCTGATFTVIVTVNPKPFVGTINQVICSGTSLSINPVNGVNNSIVPSGTTYTWTVPNNTSVTGDVNSTVASATFSQQLINTTISTQNLTYTFIPTSGANGSCVGNAFLLNVQLNPTPIVNNHTITTCSGVQFSYTPSNVNGQLIPAGTTYSWAIPAVTNGLTGGTSGINQATIAQTLNNPTIAAQTATYQITPTGPSPGFCVGTPFNIAATINISPLIPDTTLKICSGSTISFNPVNNPPNTLVPSGTTYSWGNPVVSPLGSISNATTGTNQPNFNQTNLVNTTAANATATYIITPTSSQTGNCIGLPFTVIVTIYPKATIPNQTATVCSGQLFTVTPITALPGTIVPTGVLYSWSSPVVDNGISGHINEIAQTNINGTLTNSVAINQSATYLVTPATGLNNQCIGSPFNVVVTVKTKPVIPNQFDTICSGQTTVLTLVNNPPTTIYPTGTTFTWGVPVSSPASSITGGSALSNQSGLSQALTNTSINTAELLYTITPTMNGCVGNAFTFKSVVNPKPVITNQTITICSGSKTNFSPSNTNGNIIPANTKYTWTVANQLSVNGETNSSTALALINDSLVNTTNTAQTVVYTVTPISGVNGACIGATFTLTVIVNPMPFVANQTSVICSGNAFTISPTNGSGNIVPSPITYTWSTPVVNPVGSVNGSSIATNSSSISQVLTTTSNTSGQVTYTITPSTANCTGLPFTATITVQPKPIISNQALIICSSDTFNLNLVNGNGLTVPAGTTYTWTISNNTNITGASAVSSPSSTISQALINTSNSIQTINYLITPVATNNNNCVGQTFTLTVTVKPKPSIANYSVDICSGSAFTLNTSTNVANIVPLSTLYTWTASSNSLITGSINNSVPAATLSNVLTNNSTVQQSIVYSINPSSNGCNGTVFNVTVNVNPTPVIPAQAQTICSGQAFNIAISSGQLNTLLPTGTTYTWALPTSAPIGAIIGGTAASNQSVISQTLTNTAITPATLTYSILPKSGATGTCIGLPFTTTITVNPTPVVINYIDSICSATNFTKTPANGNGNTIPANTLYTWTVVDNPQVSGESSVFTGVNSISQNLTNLSNTNQTVVYTVFPVSGATGNCIGNSFTVTVVVKPKPFISNLTASICSGQSFSFNPVNNPPNTILPVGTTYSWALPTQSPNGSVIGTSAQSNQSTVSQQLTNLTAASADVTYTITPKFGACTGTNFTYTITVNTTPVIPNQTLTVCSGAAINFTPTNNPPSSIIPNGITYSWAAPISNPVGIITGGTNGANETSINEPLGITNTSNATATLTYSVIGNIASGGTCISNSFNLTVTVLPKATIPDQTTSICSQTAMTFTPTNGGNTIIPTGTTYTWTNQSLPASVTGNSAGNNLSVITGNHTNLDFNNQHVYYTVTPSSGPNNICVGSNFILDITLKPKPQIPNQTDTICSAQLFTISPVNNGTTIVPTTTSYSWNLPTLNPFNSISGTSIQTNQSLISQTLSNLTDATATATYTVTPTASNGCVGPTFSVNIVVGAVPFIPASTLVACSGSAFSFSPTTGNPTPQTKVPAGTKYTWSAPIVTGNMLGGVAQNVPQTSFNGTLINPTALAQTATYTVTPISGSIGNCIGATFTVTVTIQPTPFIVDMTTSTCSGSIFAVQPSNSQPTNIVPSGTVYSWTAPAVTGNITGGSNQVNQNNISQVLTNPTNANQTANYSVTPSTGIGCVGPVFNVLVNVNPTPVIPLQTASICSGSNFTIQPVNAGSTIVPSNTTYTWGLPTESPINSINGQATGINQASIFGTLQSNLNTLSTMTYIVTPTSGATGTCVGAPFSSIVTVQPSPEIGNQTVTICSSQSFTLTPQNTLAFGVVPSGTSYSWSAPTVTGSLTGGATGVNQTFISGSFVNPTNVTQTAKYIVTPTSGVNGNCIGDTFTITVNVNPKPFIPNKTEVICSGTSFNFSPVNASPSTIVPNGTTYSWSAPIVSGGITGGLAQFNQSTISQTLVNPTNIAQTATYTVTATSPSTIGGCSSNTFTVTVTVNPTPVIPTQNSIVCSGVAFNLTPINGSPNANTIVPSSTTYSWALPAITGGLTGAQIGLSETSVNGSFNNPTNLNQTATYTVTPTSGAAGTCIGLPFEYIVTVKPTPTIPAQTKTICSGDAFTVSPVNNNGTTIVPSGTTYSWTLPISNPVGVVQNATTGLNQTSINQTLSSSSTSSSTATYSITPQLGTCVGSQFPLVVTINPTPVIPTQNLTICSGETINFAPSNIPSGTIYTWTAPNVTGNISGGSAQSVAQPQIIQTLTNPTNSIQTATYIVSTVSGAAGACAGNPFTLIVTVNPKPVISNLTVSACSNSLFNTTPINGSPTSTVIVPVGTTYTWSIPQMNGGITGGIAGISSSTITGTLINPTSTANTAIYTVIPTSGVAGSCIGSNFTVTVTVNPSPVIPNTTASICSENAFSISPVNVLPSSIVPSGTTYSWLAPSVTSGVTGGSAQSNQTLISQVLTNPTATAQTATYVVTPASGAAGSCQGNPFTILVNVNPKPVIPDRTTSVCSGAPFSLSIATNLPTTIVPGGTTYSWSTPVLSNGLTNGQAGNGTTISGTLINNTAIPQTAIYTVTPTSGLTGNCPGSSFTFTITVNPAPVIPAQNLSICSGSSFLIAPVSALPTTIIPTGTKYTWPTPVVTSGVSGGSAATNQLTISQLLNNPTSIAQTATYTITPTSGAAGTCVGTSFSATIVVNPTPFIPTQNTSVCSGNPFTVSPIDGATNTIVPLNTSYSWSAPIVTGGISGGSAASNQVSISQTLINTTSLVQTATYLVTPTSGVTGNCVGLPFTVVVNVQPIPVISNTTINVCSNSNFSVTPANAPPTTIVPTGTIYSWGIPQMNNGVTGGIAALNQATIFGNLNNPTSTNQTALYTVTPASGVNGACIGNTFTILVNVNPTPVVPAFVETICSQGTFTVSPTNIPPASIVPTGTTYSWTNPIVTNGITGGSSLINQNQISQTLTNPTTTVQTATYTVTPTSGAIGTCQGNSFTITVNVNPKPVIPNQIATACSGAPFSVSLATILPNTIIPSGTTYTWSAPTVTGGLTGGTTGNGTTIFGTLTNPTNLAQTATYTVTPTSGSSGSCNGSPFTLTLTVNPAPFIPAQNTAICSGTLFTVNPVNNLPGTIVPAGTTYTWGTPLVSGGITGSSANSNQTSISQTLTNPTSVNQNATYTITPTSGANGACVGPNFTATIVVQPKPFVPAQTAIVCSGNPFTINPINGVANAVIPSGTTYSWSNPVVTGGMTGGSAASNQTSVSQTLVNTSSISQTATYTVTPISGLTGNCNGNTFTVVVTVQPIPFIGNMASSVCSNSLFTVSPTNAPPGTIVPAGTTYSWQVPIMNGGITGGITQSNQTTINGTLQNPTSSNQTAVYTVIPTSGAAGACVGEQFTVTVTVLPTPVVPSVVQTICSGGLFNVTPVNVPPSSIIPAGTTYSWLNPVVTGGLTGGIGANNQTAISQTLNNPTNILQTATYTVVPSSGNAGICQGNPFTVTINVNPKPVIPNQSAAACSGAPFNVSLTNNAPVTIVPAGTTYAWSAPTVTGGMTGGQAGNGSTISGSLVNSTNIPQTATYTVTPTSGTSGLCPGNSFILTMTINPTPLLPGQNAAACSGNTFNITPTNSLPNSIVPNGTTYSWANPIVTGGVTGGSSQVNQNSISQTLINPTNILQTATYLVTPTSGVAGACVGPVFTTTITIQPKPSIPNKNIEVCSNLAFAVQPNNNDANSIVPAGTTYSWSSPIVTGGMTGGSAAANQSSISQTLINTTNLTQTATYTVTPTSGIAGSCAGSNFTIVVNVKAVPKIQNYTLATCSNSAFTVAPINNQPITIVPAGTTYTWQTPVVTGLMTGSSSGGNQLLISQTLANPTNTAQTALYHVIPTNQSCIGDTFDINLTVNPTPKLTNNTLAICSGNPFNYALVNNPPATIIPAGTLYSWLTPTQSILNPITGGSAQTLTSTINQTLINTTNVTESLVYSITPITPAPASCQGTPFVVTVNVNPVPVIPNQTLAICSGSTFNFTPINNQAGTIIPANTTYSWGIPTTTGGIVGGVAATGQPAILQNLINLTNVPKTATYTVTPISGAAGNCPGASFTLTVTVNPTPHVLTKQVTVCSGVAFNVSPVNGQPTEIVPVNTTYSWAAPTMTPNVTGGFAMNNQGSIGQALFNTSATAGTATYTVIATSGAAGNCLSQPFEVIVTVNPQPTVISSLDTLVCNNSVVNHPLVANIPTNFTWVSSQPNIPNVQGASLSTNSSAFINDSLINNTTTPQVVIYTVTPTSSPFGCVGTAVNIAVTVNPNVVVNPPLTTTICSGGQVNFNLSANIPSTFVWFDSPPYNGNVIGTSTIQVNGNVINDILVNTNPNSSGEVVNYSVIPTSVDGQCKGTAQSITVLVSQPLVYTGPSALTICSGDSLSIPLSANLPSTFVWYSNQPNTANVSGATTSLTSTASINDVLIANASSTTIQTVEYLVYPTTLLNGCSSNGFPVTVSINPTAFVPTTDTVTICSGNSVDFSLSSNVASTFNWLAQPNINVFGESTANQTTNIISDLLVNVTALPETVIYNYSATSVANSCQGNLGELLVIVNPTPTADFSLIDYSICENAPVVFTNLTTPASNYYWTFGDGTSSFVTNPTYTYQGINGSFDVELFASNSYGCTDSITKTVSVGAAPLVSFSASVDKACEGQTILFTDNLNTPNTLLTWVFGDGTTSNNPGFVDHIYNSNGCFDVTLTVADATTGCSATVTEDDIVCLYANPTAFFTVDSVIHFTTNPEFEFTNGSLNGYTYVWNFGDGGSSVSTDIVHTYPPTINNYFVTLYTYNEAGCVDSMFMNVSVREELIYFVPNTFTPDLNGVNDLFLPVFTSGFDVNEFSFEVYNRWGNLVFETDNYLKGWDGKLMTGEKAQDGIYTWKIKFRGLLDEYGKYEVGHVTLIR